jgi:hypothetical protein
MARLCRKHLSVASLSVLCKRLSMQSAMQLASARSEQERLEVEARRLRDSAHDQQLALLRQMVSATKVLPSRAPDPLCNPATPSPICMSARHREVHEL